mgnify:FL=1
MKEFYSVSEIANFFNISRQTLIYYDKINIFKPKYVNEKNNYRYYSRDQFSELSFLLLLKNTGFSLKDIEIYFKSSDLNESKEFLKRKLLEIDNKIKELKLSKEGIEKKLEHIEKVLKIKNPVPTIKIIPKMKVIKVDLKPPYDDLEFEKATLKLKKILKRELTDEDKIFSAIKKENIIREYKGGANYLGKVLNSDEDILGTDIEEKKYVSVIHAGLYNNIYLTYIKAIEYIESKKLKIVGDSIEFFSQFTLFWKEGAGGYMEILIPVEEY